jgi:hypothetical protein
MIWPAKDNSVISIMVEIFIHPLVGALCLIVFHIQAVMDSPDHCAWQLGLQVLSSRFSATPTAPQMQATRAFDCSTGRTGQPSDSKGSGGQCPPA